MEKVVISLKDVCPALEHFTTPVSAILLDPNRELESEEVCDVGFNSPVAQIDSSVDMMLNPEILIVNVFCEGCESHLPKGFSTQITRKVSDSNA